MTYDSKSYELAEHFLSDTPGLNTEKNKDALAQEIQAAIEAWFSEARQWPL